MVRVDYRKAIQTDVWHWDSNCLKWPAKAFVCSYDKPTTGKLCNECSGSQ
jgi:hypothetical protein